MLKNKNYLNDINANAIFTLKILIQKTYKKTF